MNLKSKTCLFLAGILFSSLTVFSQDKSNCLSLDQLVEKALKASALIKAADEEINVFEAKLLEAESAAYPYAEMKSVVSFIPGQKGSPQKGFTDYDQWGIFSYSEVSAILPLYTFGKIENLKKIARIGVNIGDAKKSIALLEVTARVKKAFFSLIFARELRDVIEEGTEYLNKAKNHLQKMEDEDDPEYDQVEMLKIRVYEAEVESRKKEALRLLNISKTILMLSAGVKEGESFEIAQTPFQKIQIDIGTKEQYIETALKNRTELVALDRAIMARGAEVALRESQFMPDIFFLGQFTYGYSNAADSQESPFAYDPFNTYSGKAAIGMKVTLDIAKKISQYREAVAEMNKLRAQREELVSGIKIEIEKGYNELRDNCDMIAVNKKAYEAARGWVVAKSDLYDSGLGDLNEVLTGLTEFYKRKIEYMKSILDFNLSVVSLERAMGKEFLKK
jgi:outer membrane protein TolC